MEPPLKMVANNLPALKTALAKMARQDVQVGVPSSKSHRDDGSGMTNATLAYVHDKGSPAQNIPARPFMQPGINKAKPVIEKAFFNAGKDGLEGKDIEPHLQRAGLAAQRSIQGIISEGIAPPLKPGTILNRWRSRRAKGQRKGEKQYKELVSGGMGAAEAQAVAGIKPLYNTGELLRSITYVIRK